MCSGSEAGSYLRPIDFVYHSTLGLRVIKKKKKDLSWSHPFLWLRKFGTLEYRSLVAGLLTSSFFSFVAHRAFLKGDQFKDLLEVLTEAISTVT